ncbi:MAG: hypothetical protein ACFFG0_34825 [Candidatus Thorarchaeota archaeon]
MKSNIKWPWSGKYEIWSIKNNKRKKIADIDNLIVNWAKNTLATALMGTDYVMENVKIKYLAIGDDNTAPLGSDSTLVNEVFRTPFVSQSNTSTGEITSEFYILDSDYSGSIKEIGLFGGNSATATTDTGNLLSRALWSYTKSASEEIYIKRIDTIS